MEKQMELDTLRREHRDLDRRIDEMLDRPYLLPDEEIEVQRMKKLKLAKKDRIFALERELSAN